MTKLAFLVALVGCSPLGEVKGLGADLAELGPCDLYADLGGGTCGEVFSCDLGSATAELCWVDDNAQELTSALLQDYPTASCRPTPRGGALGWPCVYDCSPGHKGCNAYQGCYCP